MGKEIGVKNEELEFVYFFYGTILMYLHFFHMYE